MDAEPLGHRDQGGVGEARPMLGGGLEELDGPVEVGVRRRTRRMRRP